MNSSIIDRIVERAEAVLTRPPIEVEASGRHAHLSREAVDALFGKGYALTKQADLSQPGQFSCKERVRVIGPKGEFPAVVVLGPERAETQIEISSTDAVALGVPAIVRLSGDISGSAAARLVGPAGELRIERGVIVAMRHIHMTPADAARLGIRDGRGVSAYIWSERSTTFKSVIVRVSPKFTTRMHIDYDEANACGFRKGMTALIEL